MAKASDVYAFDEQYRDTLATVDEKGNRIWVYPKQPHGRYYVWRTIVAVVLLGILFAGPFIKIGGQPLLLLNIFERKFVIFGVAFWPQDFHLFVLAMLIFFVFIIMFTVVFGRLWCGWACPQTIFMEMVFRRIEYWIEGNANQQRKLDNGPWNFNKIVKKGTKHLLFILISLLISHTVMAYLLGWNEMKEVISAGPLEHWSGFLGLMFFTGLFYWVFSYFREQACTAVCPYGRLQGVLLVKNSVAVMYDWIRGEPRGKLKKNQPQDDKGDCVDCKLCVHVCPTGIDIRNGTQLECVNCTACIDACDDVMEKVGKPRGLIRYASQTSIEKGTSKILTTRVIGYAAVFLLLATAFTLLFMNRSDIEATVTRARGTLYYVNDEGNITNLFNIQFVNKTFDPVALDLKVTGVKGAEIERVGNEEVFVKPNDLYEGLFFIELPQDQVQGAQTPIYIEMYQQNKLVDKVKANFAGPF